MVSWRCQNVGFLHLFLQVYALANRFWFLEEENEMKFNTEYYMAVDNLQTICDFTPFL